MPQLTYPAALSPKEWTGKITSAFDKAKVGDTLGKAAAQFTKLPRELLDTAGLKGADEVKKRIDEIQSKFVKAAQAVVDLLDDVATGAGNAAKTLGKDPKAPKGADAIASKVATAAASFKKELQAAPQAALTELKSLQSKFEAQDKKEQVAAAKQAAKDKKEEEEDEDDEDISKHTGKGPAEFKNKVKGWMKSAFSKLKAPDAQPLVVTVGLAGAKPCSFFIAKSHGNREKNIMKEVAGATKSVKGIAYYLPKEKTFVLEGKALPQGAGNMRILKEWLKKDIKYSLSEKLRLQKFPGDKDAAVEEGDADAEVQQQEAAEQDAAVVARKRAESAANQPAAKTAQSERGEPANVDADKAWQAKYKALDGKIQAVIKAGGKGGDEIRKRDVELKKLEKQKGVEKEANSLLKEIEAILGKLAELAGARGGAGAPAAKTAADAGAKGNGAEPSPELRQAVGQLGTLRKNADAGVKRLAVLIRDAYVGDAQAEQARKGAILVAGKATLLNSPIEAQIDELLNIADAGQRAAKARAVQSSVKGLLQRIKGDEILSDVDKSVFDANLNVIGPYVGMLEQVDKLLGGLAA